MSLGGGGGTIPQDLVFRGGARSRGRNSWDTGLIWLTGSCMPGCIAAIFTFSVLQSALTNLGATTSNLLNTIKVVLGYCVRIII